MVKSTIPTAWRRCPTVPHFLISYWLPSLMYRHHELHFAQCLCKWKKPNDFRYIFLCRVGVPTLKKISSDLAGWLIFWTIVHEDFNNANFTIVGHIPSTHNFCPRSPRTGSATGYVGRVGASRGFVWSKNQEVYFY